MASRTQQFLLYFAVSLFLFHNDIVGLAELSWNDNRYTHLILIPVLTAGMIYLERKGIFGKSEYAPWDGMPLAAIALLIFSLPIDATNYLGEYGNLTHGALAIVLAWVAGFLIFFGPRATRAASFSLGLLVLMIPIPPLAVAVIEGSLQRGSAEVTHVMFRLTSTPVFREGLVFSLPGVTIEVARECSGIRSAISLLITTLVLSHLFLRAGWSRLSCVLLALPIAIFKNAVRIVTLSLLAVYVSQDYLHGDLHHRGGPIFSMLALALLLPAIWALRKAENHVAASKNADSSALLDRA